ncbi:hypothetical protein DEU52_13352 [Ensifer adhaerens]|nr:hypothetical protein DEU52_13352 [Ensifer adhaerens]
MPAIFEVSTITNSGDNCRRSLGPSATYAGNALANVTLAEDGFDLLVEVSDFFVELQK